MGMAVHHRRERHRDRLRDPDVNRIAASALALALILLTYSACGADYPPPSLATQVHAIFQAKCVECHGADLARPKGKFGYILDLSRVAANPKMVTPRNPSKSDLYQMVWDNEMPDPKGSSPPLTDEQKAIVRAWIEVGAPALSEAGTTNSLASDVSPAPKLTLARRIVRDVGQFHPPSTHFPIALLIVALPAELMWMFTRKDSWKHTVRFCVALGAAAAVITATLGWCDAVFSNYSGASAQILTWHRWIGTGTAVWAVFTAALSEWAHRKGNSAPLILAFRLTLLVGIVLVSAAGYLGASLIYGLHHFAW
jgi:uncharacterized membrane protein/mono/diheme cytochrome c family protein